MELAKGEELGLGRSGIPLAVSVAPNRPRCYTSDLCAGFEYRGALDLVN